MKNFHFIYIAVFSLLLGSCQKNIPTATTTLNIPELLNRPHVIGPEEEMGFIHDTYASIVKRIKADRSDIESRLALAELFMMEARISGEHGHYYPAALQVIEEAMHEQMDEPLKYRALLDKASVLMSLHQFKAAKQTGEEALAINQYAADVYGILIDANVELGEYETAVSLADKMVSIRPDLRSYSRISYLREIHGDVTGAIEAMKLAVSAGYPGMETTEWARLTLGGLYEKYGHLDSASMEYETALNVRPNYPFAIAALAGVYKTMGNEIKADSLNAYASYLIPEVGFFIDKALWEKEKGNLEQAKKLTGEILEMLADDEAAGHIMNLEMARVHLDLLGDADKALQYATKEFAVRPNNIDVNHMMAKIFFHQNEMEKANEYLSKAMHTGVKDPDVIALQGCLMANANAEAKSSF